MHILIVGASGNLGREIARALLRGSHQLRLLVHKTPVPKDLAQHPEVHIVSGDLENPATLTDAMTGIDRIVYVAGVLFRPNPEKFLPRTNTLYVRNIVDAALAAGVARFILISFPHVEENTTPDSPAHGRLDVQPQAVHALTRLDAEKYLFAACRDGAMEPVVLRAGIVYGPEMKLIEAARRLMRYKLLAIWRKPTWIHLLALPDFLRSVAIAVERDRLHGVYNICDDCSVLLQEFLDALAGSLGPPETVSAARCELQSRRNGLRVCGDPLPHRNASDARHDRDGDDLRGCGYQPHEERIAAKSSISQF